MVSTQILAEGQVGYFLSNMKSVSDAHIGDTFYEDRTSREEIEPFPGYANPKAMVFAGIYPEDPDDYEELEKAL
jgi:translation elongation factor EF-4